MIGTRIAAMFLCATLALPCLAASQATAPALVEPNLAPTQAASSAALNALAQQIQDDANRTYFAARMLARLPVDRFDDYSVAKVRDAVAQGKRWVVMLAAIKRDDLGDVDRATYDILKFELSGVGQDEQEYWLTLDLTPYQAPGNFNFAHQVLAGHPFTNAQDAEHYVSLVASYGAMLESLLQKLQTQTDRGIYIPRPALPVVRSTWTGIAAADLKPSDARVAKLDPASRERMGRELDRIIETSIEPRFARLQTMIGEDYSAKAPDAVGIGQYPGGKEVYAKLIRRYTTLALTPEQVHERGLAAVADVAARMKAIRDQLGIVGSAREFYEKLRVDPRFTAKTPADVEATFMRYIGAIKPKIPFYFNNTPKAPYGVERLALAVEAGQTFGYYSPPTAAEPRGLYYYNASDLPNRSLLDAGSLIYHELVPGHHFHVALQEENPDLSPFRKKYSVGAYTEGWAEYAASLPIEMGLYDTPEANYGRYMSEMFLAARLVVDTGMNHFGWPLEKARAYLHDVTSMSDTQIGSETLRYSTNIPGQALGYRIGYEKMWELRRRAERELGKKFDIRSFHDIVLKPGARPLPVLEVEVDGYIESQR
ncbi:MAG: DUF885 domain-containing protein [Luteimonas sp.]